MDIKQVQGWYCHSSSYQTGTVLATSVSAICWYQAHAFYTKWSLVYTFQYWSSYIIFLLLLLLLLFFRYVILQNSWFLCWKKNIFTHPKIWRNCHKKKLQVVFSCKVNNDKWIATPFSWALGTIALDPTFGSFTLLKSVSHLLNWFLWWKEFKLFRLEWIFFGVQSVDTVSRCTTSYLLAGPARLWCVVLVLVFYKARLSIIYELLPLTTTMETLLYKTTMNGSFEN
jgi:hypothetical protein